MMVRAYGGSILDKVNHVKKIFLKWIHDLYKVDKKVVLNKVMGG